MTESRAFVNYGEGFATAVVTFSGLCAILKAGCITVGNVIGVGVTERINGNVLAGNLNTANGTVDYVIIFTGSYTVGIYLVFNNNVTVAVACCRTGSASGVRSATTVVTNSGFATVGCTVCIVVEYIICEGVTESSASCAYSIGNATAVVTGSSLCAIFCTGCIIVECLIG